MGSDQSALSKLNNLQMILERVVFFPGEIIKGTLQIKTKNPLVYPQINYQIIQDEYWKCHGQSGVEKTKIANATLNYPGLKDVPLKDGVSIPFTIQIPTFAIPSFEYSLSDKVSYIRAYCFASINELSLQTQAFIIIRKPAILLESPLSFSLSSPTKVLGLFDQGPIKIEASYPTNSYGFFSFIPINIKIDSTKSKLKVKRLKTALKRKIKFLQHVKENSSLIWVDDLFSVEEEVSEKLVNYNYNIQVIEPDNIYNRYCITNTGINFGDKRQIITFLPSLFTSMLLCEYYIQIDVSFDALINITTKEPKVIMPLSIGHFGNNEDVSQSMLSANQQFEKNVMEINHFSRVNNYPEAPNLSMVQQISQPQYSEPQPYSQNEYQQQQQYLDQYSQQEQNNYPDLQQISQPPAQEQSKNNPSYTNYPSL